MATIPMEVIVQDVESPANPTPTSETNSTEESIAVPDTGAGAIGNDSTFSSSSVASIIVPVVLLVLSLATVCTLLIHRHHKRQDSKASKKEKLAAAASATTAVLAATVLIGNLVLPATKATTSDTTDTITPSEDKVSITVTRDGGVAEESIETTATITSTSDFGYKVLLSMAEGVETSNLYLNGDEASEHYIAATESTELTDNTWGYALTEDGEYSAVPLLDTPATVAEGDEPVEDEVLSIYYGVKVSSDLPAGTYSGGEIEYNLVALEPTISTLTYMQDFAKLSESGKASVLRSMAEGEQYTLRDSRDTKDYFISKLADGNVWMTQNLDLDLSTTKELTPSDTDIAENWTPSNTTINFSGTTVEGWVNSDTAPYSANPGDIYYYTSNTTEDDIKYDSLAECIEANHTEAECRHYHAGNYYNWSAAVASNNTEGTADQYYNAPSSICPKGWRLPKNRNAEGWAEGNEQDAMVSSYEGIVGELQIRGEGYQAYRSYLYGGLNTIRTNPLWLTRSGGIYYGSTGSTGSSGIYQSSTVAHENSIYQLNVGPNEIQFENGNRRNGYSIRCLAE